MRPLTGLAQAHAEAGDRADREGQGLLPEGPDPAGILGLTRDTIALPPVIVIHTRKSLHRKVPPVIVVQGSPSFPADFSKIGTTLLRTY